ncbi:MAG TPA: CpsD/CapB family tyrosine-protein kinase [Terriglobia bacterium]|jgi:capsular exopolysaccharide synthesis family protein|nr:CpsD/CapB family tyrosine-protein kinase [Terriglobia bacterium]
MNHLLKALRKIRDDDGDGDFIGSEFPRNESGETSGLQSIPVERAQIRPESRLVVWSSPDGLAADRYRLLRMHLEKLRGDGRLRTVLLTSPSPEDGKSTVALNLASTLARDGERKVLLLEADLRCPSLTRRLGLKPWPGLSDHLAGGSDVMTNIRQIDPLKFYLLPAGTIAANPGELLQSERMTQCVEALSQAFDWIVIDSTPTSPITDALVVKAQADACLLIARAGKTPREELEEAIQLLGPKFVLGIVLNGVEGLERRYSGYYEHYYGQAQMSDAHAPAKPAP